MSWLHSSSSFGWVIKLTWSRHVTLAASFCTKKVRMVMSILSRKIVELLGDIRQPFSIWSPTVLRALRSP